jgi:uncharacterized membrane protein YgcG
MWAKIHPVVKNIPRLRLLVAALLFVGLLGVIQATVAFAAEVTGQWVKTDQGLTAVRVNDKLYFNPTKFGNEWFMQENRGGVTCQSRIYFTADPRTNTNAAKSATQKFYKDDLAGDGSPACTELTSQFNHVTISGATATPGADTGTATGTTKPPDPVCDVGGLTFMICPLIKFMADATEWTAHALQSLLYVQPLNLNTADTGNVLFKAWSSILTLANIVLAIAFLFVIFAQATSTALSSYGVKKMLPRIIAAAILMNLSFYLCAFAVDLSNLAGVGVSGLLAGLGDGSVFTDPNASLAQGFGGAVGNNKITEVAAGAGLGAILIFFFLMPVLGAALAVLFTLAARLAIIVMLVMVSPLAFAAWILPNTEKYFKKWYELFTSMLVLFPLVMAVFAASAITSTIIQRTTITAGPVPDGATADFARGVLLPLIALLVQALPLFALPFLFKTASGTLARLHAISSQYANKGVNSKAAQGVQNRVRRYGKFGAIAGGKAIGNKFGGGADSRLGKAARSVGRGYTNARAFDKAVEVADAARKSGRETKINERAAELGSESKHLSPVLASFGGERYKEIVSAQTSSAFNERVKSLKSQYELQPMSVKNFGDQLADALEKGKREEVSALISHLGIAGGAGGRQRVEQVLRASSPVTEEGMQTAVNNALYRDNYSALIGKRGSLAKGGFDSRGNWAPGMQKVATEAVASQDEASIREHYNSISPETATRIMDNVELRSKVSSDESFALLEARAANLPPPPPGTVSSGRGTAPPSGGSGAGGGGTPSGGASGGGGSSGGSGAGTPSGGGGPGPRPGPTGGAPFSGANSPTPTPGNGGGPTGPAVPPPNFGSTPTYTGAAGPSAIPTAPPDLGYQGDTRINRDNNNNGQ